jgi:hypothetical protein
MAKVALNPMLKEIRGRVGNMVYRRMPNGKTIVSSLPDMSRVEWSDAQQAHRERFKEAIFYAKAAMTHPVTADHYRQEALTQGRRAFSLAVSDYFNGINLLQE